MSTNPNSKVKMRVQNEARIQMESNAIAKAWRDPSFKNLLLNDPKKALESLGYSMGEKVHIKVFEGEADTWHFVLPSPPENVQKMSEADLKKAAAAGRTHHQPKE